MQYSDIRDVNDILIRNSRLQKIYLMFVEFQKSIIEMCGSISGLKSLLDELPLKII